MLELPWDTDVLRVPMPPGWRLLGSFAPQPTNSCADPYRSCREALAHPISTSPLTGRDLRGKRVLLVVDDHSRPTPTHRFFRSVRDALVEAGADHLNVLFALGAHRAMTVEEAAAKIGAEALALQPWHNHNAFDQNELAHLGTTSSGTPVYVNRLVAEADLVVTLGAIEPHLLAGFSGGLKMLVPGCAGAASIAHNHMQGLDAPGFNQVGAAEPAAPMRRDLEEAARMIRAEVFIVNVALTGGGEIAEFFCGDPIDAFQQGVAYVRQHSECIVPEKADVVIANSRPLDVDLRQGMKCLANTLFAARPGGIVIGMLRCLEGLGDVQVPSARFPYGVSRLLARSLGRHALLLHDWLRWHDPIEERFLGHFGVQMLQRNELWFYSDGVDPRVSGKLSLLRQFRSLETMMAAAERRVGRKATVAVFPLGGISYAGAS